MADPHFLALLASREPAAGPSACPCVADLIQYALGQLHGPERQRIETHLEQSSCSDCRSWIDKASRFREDPRPNETAFLSSPAVASRAPSSPPVTDRTPIPESAQWQRQAFSELERRLRALEDS
jgi:predicted anti-sigma-YlaC factor YlaD